MSAILRARTLALVPFMLAAVLVASMFAFTPSAEAASRGQKIHNALQIVKNQKGDPYRYGAAGPNRFDCSGLIYYSYRKAGITNIPRTSGQQARFTKRIKKSNMRKGDLMFFHNGGSVYHVAVFAGWKDGRRKMVHAPSTGKRVHVAKPWTKRWYAGTLR
ncbi:MAG TPA: C40 family peptidase [Nocardioidaceae bacterium]|nr:C40 family peptidase [Nocardioidaceae bacterium]